MGWPNSSLETAVNVASAERRGFTPTVEVNLCEHATLASVHVLCGEVPRGQVLEAPLDAAGAPSHRNPTANVYGIFLPLGISKPRSVPGF